MSYADTLLSPLVKGWITRRRRDGSTYRVNIGGETRTQISGWELTADKDKPGNVLLYHATRKPGLVRANGLIPHRAGVIRRMDEPLVFFARSAKGAKEALVYEEDLRESQGQTVRKTGDVWVFEASVPVADIDVRPNGDVTTRRTVHPSEIKRDFPANTLPEVPQGHYGNIGAI